MNDSHAKIKYIGEFSQLKIHSLALQHEKKTCSNWQSNIACLSVRIHNRSREYSGSKIWSNLFKSFVSCNLQFQAFYV